MQNHGKIASSLSRRKLFGSALAASATLVACKQVEPQENITLNSNSRSKKKLTMTCAWPKGSPGLWTNAEYISRRVSELTNGDLEIQLYAAGELVPAFEAFDAVADGSIDCYHAAESYWTGKSKAYPFFTTVPGGMNATEFAAWVAYGGGQQLWDKLSKQYGIKPFMAGNTGHQMGGWFKKKIESLNDLKGLKIRIPGLGADLLRELGASPVSLPGSETFTALQTGVIDATEWVAPWTDLSMGFYQVAPYYYGPGFHEPGTALSFGMNLDVWDSLPSYHQLVLTTVFGDVTQKSMAESYHFNAMTLNTLKDKGVEVLSFPEDVTDAAFRLSEKVRLSVASSGNLEGEIVQSYEAALMQYKIWSQLGDGGYLKNRL